MFRRRLLALGLAAMAALCPSTLLGMERADMERWLNRWIGNYVVGNPEEQPDEVKAKRPLSWAKIEVQDVPGQPGFYRARALMRPHFQLEGLDVSLRLVAKQLNAG